MVENDNKTGNVGVAGAKPVFLMRNEGSEFVFKGFSGEKSKFQYVWGQFLEGLNSALASAFNNKIYVKTYAAGELESKIVKIINKLEQETGKEYFKVSTDPIAPPGSVKFGVSRAYKPQGMCDMGICSRPGFSSLEEQVENIKAMCNYKDIILIEDDIFSGGTLGNIVGLFKKQNADIAYVITGFQVGDPSKVGVPVLFAEKYAPSSVIDLNDPRDYVLGANESGLVIVDGADKYKAPYILPWVSTTARGSVPHDRAEWFAKTVLNLNKKMYETLGSYGIDISLKDTPPYFQKLIAKEYPLIKTEILMGDLCKHISDTFDKKLEVNFPNGNW